MVAQITAMTRSKLPFGDGHAHCIGETLGQRSGGDFDARGNPHLWMAGRTTAELTECLEVLKCQVVARHVEHRIQKDRGVTCREHETVPVWPCRICRIKAHHPPEEHMGERRKRHGGAWMA